jgi:hypothetical protein
MFSKKLLAVAATLTFVLRPLFAATASTPTQIAQTTLSTPATTPSSLVEKESLSILAQVLKASAINYDASVGSILSYLDRLYGSISDKALELYDYVVKEKSFKREVCKELVAECPVKLPKSLVVESDDAFSISSIVDRANEYICADVPENWDYLGEEDGISVWRLKKVSPVRCGYEESRWNCVKSEAIIDLTPAELRDYLMNSAEVQKYNKYSGGRLDVEEISDTTKVVWNRTKLPFAIKPYDFCTLMHVCRHPKKNVEMIVSKGISHPLVPVMSDYSRSEIYVGVNILTPVPGPDGKGKMRTKLTNINRVRYAGLHPFMASKRSFRGSVDYLSQLRSYTSKLHKKKHHNSNHHRKHHHHDKSN